MPADYQIHTSLSNDSKGEVLECVKVAPIRKLEEVGISDYYVPERFRTKLDQPPAYRNYQIT